MSMARLVITAVTLEGRSKSAVAAEYGLSRRWVQKLLQRYAADGEAAFEPRSRRPHSSPNKLPVTLEDEIVELRKFLAEEGLDAGPSTIAYHLAERHGEAPSFSTIWRVLSRRGFVVPEPHKRPRSSIVRFEAEMPNERWQADITHVRIARSYEVEVLNQLDDHSRLLVGSDAKGIFKASDIVACFEKATVAYGTPVSYLTDNAAVFTGAYRGLGWVALERELVPGALCCATPAHITPRPAARSNASTRRSRNGSSTRTRRTRSPSSSVSSMSSGTTTTTSAPTAPSGARPRSRPSWRGRGPSPTTARSPSVTSAPAGTWSTCPGR